MRMIGLSALLRSRVPVDGRSLSMRPGSDVTASELSGFLWHLDVPLLSIALERVTIVRFMLARVTVAAVVPQSTAKSPGTCAVG